MGFPFTVTISPSTTTVIFSFLAPFLIKIFSSLFSFLFSVSCANVVDATANENKMTLVNLIFFYTYLMYEILVH